MSSVKVITREQYQFAAEPKAVKSRSKYRGPNDQRVSDYEELQNDARVRNNRNNINEISPSKNSLKSTNNAKRTNENNTGDGENEIQEVYVELTDKQIQDESKLNPDYYVDRAPTPEYKPLEPGVDAATQIEDRELFDYVLEVEPILQVLVGKTLQQAQMELREEDEKLEEMRHKMRFEKTRNAELMVTQRKEALHVRKQEEKQRREKQHIVQQNEKVHIHQKYISRLIAKAVTFGMNDNSIKILANQGVLQFNLKNELKKDYVPYLLQNTSFFLNQHSTMHCNVQGIMDSLTSEVSNAHAVSVKKEFDRKKKIADDKKAEDERLAAEQRRRRERRRLLRLHFAKSSLLDTIKISVINKAQDIEEVFSSEITDIFPATKESVSTIGGLLGELWLILDVLQTEHQTELKVEELVQMFVKLFTENYKPRDFSIYLNEQTQQITQDTLNHMLEDLVSFNQNKIQKIDELYDQLGQINCFQNLGTLQTQQLLDQESFKKLNKALLYIFFSSIEYKVPEKKQEKALEVQTETNRDPEDPSAEPKTSEEAPIQDSEPQEEEYKIPEITPLEQAIVQIKRKFKLNFVKDWEFRTECDAIVRFRIPLNRQVKGSTDQLESNQPAQESLKTNSKERKSERQSAKVVEEVLPQESFNDKVVRLIATEDFIEAFNGTTFEKEKLEFTEQIFAEQTPLKVFNTNLIEGKYIAHTNERAQDELRKELIKLIKQCVPAWKEADAESTLAKVYIKYKKNEKVVLNSLISDPEAVPVFDVESA